MGSLGSGVHRAGELRNESDEVKDRFRAADNEAHEAVAALRAREAQDNTEQDDTE
ncbi:hypothetical protein GCM10010372_82330 [Streptomyces tauricus]|nr:hypothetical protein GCM10010372_82330 [Streptomyces tauricus]